MDTSNINRIKELRTIEAMRKNYMGFKNGKLGTICRFLGQPIISAESALFDSTPFNSTNDVDDQEEMLNFEEDDEMTTLGWLFDGLSRGMHLEIKYIDHVLTVLWQGRKVYVEDRGELECFVPDIEWESNIDKLFIVALPIKKNQKIQIQEHKESEKKKSQNKWLKKIQEIWGINF